MEAIRGLRDTLSRGIEDTVQREFAAASLKCLLQKQSYTQLQSYDWAVSSLEIHVEGDVLGSGAFGTVYAGRWNGTKVAVKQLARGTPRQVLIKEIDIWRRMQHTHVASFFRACIDSNPPLLISEYYQFGNIIVYLSDFPHANRVELALQISLGMQFLHNERVVHGDLKPANILIDDAHRARITDFGLSRIKTSLTTQTMNDTSVNAMPKRPGTKAFMAPERLLRGTNNFKSDIYAWAMTVYQIMTDEAPFQYLPEEDLRDIVAIQDVRPEKPDDPVILQRGLTDVLWGLLEQCWIKDRNLRPTFQDISKSLSPKTALEPSGTMLIPKISIENSSMEAKQQASHPVRSPSVPSESSPISTDSMGLVNIPETDVYFTASDFHVHSAPGFGNKDSYVHEKARESTVPSSGGLNTLTSIIPASTETVNTNVSPNSLLGVSPNKQEEREEGKDWLAPTCAFLL
ncbi:hypothetical protein VKT23_010203 [Stygiomarasmius scandens]|uniref:Protein kinase domain-containing protein n=1 Tax=Marasmiellus scandens TaxID=2682957 RepID=A0ABR1JCX9_9AGAR